MRVSLAFLFALAIVAGCKEALPQTVGNQSGVCVAGNGNGNLVVGQPCAATPTPAPAATAPPLRDQQSWFGEEGAEGIYTNHNATTAQLAQYSDLCEGFENVTTTIFPVSCPGPLNPDGTHRAGFRYGWIIYIESGMGLPNSAGHDVDIPFGSYTNNSSGTACNAAAKSANGNFWNNQISVTLGGTAYTLPDYTSTGANNWFLYANGGTVGNVNYMGAGQYASSGTYIFYLNMGSASLQAYINDVLQHCSYNTNYRATAPFDNAEVFNDNVYIGFQSAGWDKWDRYSNERNFGNSTTTGTYADPRFGASGNSFVPGSFFNGTGTYHLRTGAITTNDTPINSSTDTSYRSNQVALLGGLKHASGSSVLVEGNGGFINSDTTLQKNSNSRFMVSEELLIGCFGTCPNPQTLPYNGPTQQQIKSALSTNDGMRAMFDNYAAMYQEVVKPGINPNVSGMALADQPPFLVNATTTTVLGTGIEVQNQNWEYAPIISMFSDDAPYMTSEFSNLCGLSSNTTIAGSNCMDVWPFDFAMPSGRITPMPADPTDSGGLFPCGQGYSGGSGLNWEGTGRQCTKGGGSDTAILCDGVTIGFYCTQFNHFWVFKVTGTGNCTAYDRRQWANCAIDIGPLAVIINATGSSKTITSANLNTWVPNVASKLNYLFVPCVPTSAMWGTTSGSPVYAMPQSGTLGYGTGSVCSGSSGFDVPSGGTWDDSKLLTDITGNSQVLYDGQVLYLVGGGTSNGNVAAYDGCAIGKSGDPYNADISTASIDPNSATIIAGLPNDTLNGAGGFEQVNLANNGTATLTINTQTGGHNPPFWNATTEPWLASYFIEPLSDAHAMVLNTDSCKEYEGYNTTYSGGVLQAYSGGLWDFTQAYSVSTPTFGITGTAMASDLCFFCGMVKWNGEMGASTPAINHALNFGYPGGQGVSQWGIVPPAQGPTGLACTSNCTHPLHYGDHLRLHSSYSCGTDSEAVALCNALKRFGMYFADTGSEADLYFADADGAGTTNPYNTAVITWLQGVHISDFDVLTESAVNCQPGHAGCT